MISGAPWQWPLQLHLLFDHFQEHIDQLTKEGHLATFRNIYKKHKLIITTQFGVTLISSIQKNTANELTARLIFVNFEERYLVVILSHKLGEIFH